MKGNQILGIGLLILSVTLIARMFINLPDIVYLVLLLIAIVFEIVAVIKMKNEDKH